MKKILLMALIAVFAVACSSKGTHIGGSYLRYAKSDFTGKVTCEVRDSTTNEKVVSTKDGFTNVVYQNGVFLAAKDGVWGLYVYRDKVFKRLLENKTFTSYLPKIVAKVNYLDLTAADGKYIYIQRTGNLIGPFKTYELSAEYGLFFVSDGQKWGAYDLHTGKLLVPVKYENLVYAVADKGGTAFYAGKQRILADGALGKALTNYAFQIMKKEAAAKKTPWPEQRYGCVKVKTLR